MKREFITPTIETEMLTPQETIMARVLNVSEESKMTTVIKDERPGESEHWYGPDGPVGE